MEELLPVYFKDLSRTKQQEIIMDIDEDYVANLCPLTYINIEDVENLDRKILDKNGKV